MKTQRRFVKAEHRDEVRPAAQIPMRQERLPAAGRRPRAGVRQRQQGSGGVGNIISNVLRKRNGISRSAPRLLCTLEPGDPSALRDWSLEGRKQSRSDDRTPKIF